MRLKGLFIFCLLGLFSHPAFTQVRLSQGEILEVRIVDNFTSKNIPSKIQAVIDVDVKDPATGKILIRRGAPVRIDAKIQKPQGKGRPGKITLNLLSTEAVDGQNIRLSRTAEFLGKNRRGLALGLGIGLPLGTIVCFPWGFACLAIKGLHAEVPAGTILDYVIVAEDYTINPQ